MFAFPTLVSVFYSCCIALNSQLYFVFRREPSGPENGVGSLLKWYIFTPIVVSAIICESRWDQWMSRPSPVPRFLCPWSWLVWLRFSIWLLLVRHSPTRSRPPTPTSFATLDRNVDHFWWLVSPRSPLPSHCQFLGCLGGVLEVARRGLWWPYWPAKEPTEVY